MVRASHNTFMTMLTEHGIPGATFYIMLLLWILSRVRRLGKAYQTEDHGMMAALLPGVAAVLLGITVGDMFVTHARLEVRIWFIGILMAMYNLMVARQQALVPAPAAAEPVPPAKPSRVQVARRGAPGQAVPGRRR
jgi:O-antigen ligase